MKKLLLIAFIICSFQTMKAQFTFGLHGNFEYPLKKTGGVSTPLLGPGLEVSYGILKEKLDAGLMVQHRWTLNWPDNPAVTSYMAKFRYIVSSKEKGIRMYAAIGFGLYKRKEEIHIINEPVMVLKEDGVVVMPQIGFIVPVKFLKNAFVDMNAYYQDYSQKTRPSGFGINVGLLYRLN
jgi:hypothetical protein